MRQIILLLLALCCAGMVQSCVDETGAGTPSPKSMFLEHSEYNVNIGTDSVDYLMLRWIDVSNATYKVFLTNTISKDTTYLDTSFAEKGALETLALEIPYSTLTEYVDSQHLLALPTDSVTSFTVGVTGTPVDLTKPTALKPTGSTVSATINYKRSVPRE